MPLEIWVKMSVGFDEDPKVVALAAYGDEAPMARDLYLAMVRYCRRNLSDGLVPTYELMRLAYPLAMPLAQRIASHLVDEELITPVATGWLVNAYVKRNGTRADIEARAKVQAENARRRWSSPGQPGSGANRTANRTANRNASGNGLRTNLAMPEKEKDKTPAPAPAPARTRGTRPDATPPAVIQAAARRPGGPAEDVHGWAAKARAGITSPDDPSPGDRQDPLPDPAAPPAEQDPPEPAAAPEETEADDIPF